MKIIVMGTFKSRKRQYLFKKYQEMGLSILKSEDFKTLKKLLSVQTMKVFNSEGYLKMTKNSLNIK